MIQRKKIPEGPAHKKLKNEKRKRCNMQNCNLLTSTHDEQIKWQAKLTKEQAKLIKEQTKLTKEQTKLTRYMY